jgi:hypothetical protein
MSEAALTDSTAPIESRYQYIVSSRSRANRWTRVVGSSRKEREKGKEEEGKTYHPEQLPYPL